MQDRVTYVSTIRKRIRKEWVEPKAENLRDEIYSDM